LQVGAQAPIRQDLDVSPEEFLNLLLEGDHVEQCAAGFDIDEKVDVAVLAIIPACDRTEHSYVADASTRCDVQDFAPVPPEQFKPHEPMIAAPTFLLDASAAALLVEAAD
jgi:hypothetical protein